MLRRGRKHKKKGRYRQCAVIIEVERFEVQTLGRDGKNFEIVGLCRLNVGPERRTGSSTVVGQIGDRYSLVGWTVGANFRIVNFIRRLRAPRVKTTFNIFQLTSPCDTPFRHHLRLSLSRTGIS